MATTSRVLPMQSASPLLSRSTLGRQRATASVAPCNAGSESGVRQRIQAGLARISGVRITPVRTPARGRPAPSAEGARKRGGLLVVRAVGDHQLAPLPYQLVRAPPRLNPSPARRQSGCLWMAHGNVLNLKPRSSPSSFIISTLPSGTPPPSPTPSSLPAKPLLFPLLPPLPLSLSPLSSSALPLFLPQDALEPHISRSALEAHWSGHHGRQLAALNRQLDADLALKRLPLEELVKVAYNGGNPLPCFNLAAEVGEVGGRGEEEDRREGRGWGGGCAYSEGLVQ
ncbi:unnamed protein product [Closterium sp. NIES-54]